jgi:phosphatidylserine/phosphatidylglycerophosphate/cardiolipin synthase-like enzyme
MKNQTEKSYRIQPRFLYFAAVVALLITILSACGQPSRSITETVAGDYIAVFFTAPQYTDDINYSGGIDENLVALIDAAQESVDVAAYDIELDSVADALIRAHTDDLAVRIVTDEGYADEDALIRLRESGLPVVARPESGNGIMHNKFVVVDGTWVWTGSWNMTFNGTYRNDNNAVIVASRALAGGYTAEFEEMFAGQFGASSPAATTYPSVNIAQENGIVAQVSVAFAPEDGVEAQLTSLLADAESSIRFMAFVFTSEPLAQLLSNVAANGIDVRGVLESRSAGSEHSQHDLLLDGGVDVRIDGNPYTMHHKVLIIDERFVVLGSYNFSASAERRNDENILIVDDPTIATLYLAEFDRVYNQATVP